MTTLVDGMFYIDDLTQNFYLREEGVWVLKGTLSGSGGGGGTGDVIGPTGATDGTPVVFDGVSGKRIKNISYADFKTLLTLAKADVGLGNVDDTTDAAKPVSTATQAALDALTKADVGLGNVDNTSDAAKPVSTATQAALDALTKADVGLGNVDNTSDAAKPVSTATQAAFDALTKASVGLSNVDNTSDVSKPVSTATQAAIDALLNAANAEQFKGLIDCSTNPNYPAAEAGYTYRVSVAGKIGGASGPNVEVNDRLQCIVDGTASGNQATVGANWWITQGNIDGAVIGPASAVDGTPMVADGSSGKLIKNVTYPAFKTLLALVKGDVGLGNVDNTADTAKPVSTAQQTALDAKVAGPASVVDDLPAIFNGTTGKLIKSKTYAAFKTLLALVKGDVGLGNVDNTADEDASFFPNALTGFGIANSAVDAVNDIVWSPGVAADSLNVALMKNTTAFTKRLDANWVVGDNQGGLDIGTVNNVGIISYHAWAIGRSDTKAVDGLLSLSATAPTMPSASWDRKRRVGSFLRIGGTNWLFLQDGNKFSLKATKQDLDGVSNFGTLAQTATLTLPTGIRVEALLRVALIWTDVSSAVGLLFSDLAMNDEPAELKNSQLTGIAINSPVGNSGQASVMTNTLAQIRYRASINNANFFAYARTVGYIDTRGQ